MSARRVIIGTRGSALAMAQTNWVVEQLRQHHPGVDIQTRIIKTTGDRELNVSLAVIGGKGVFVKEIEEAMLRGEIDAAVHSLKDLPTETPAGLCLAAVPEREDPRDFFVANVDLAGMDEALNAQSLQQLPTGATVATSSLRRRAELLHWRPDLRIVDIRGNVDTRLRKLRDQKLHGLILAAAGLRRLGLEVRGWPLPLEAMLPAPGQGALALEARGEDSATCQILSALEHAATRCCVQAERAVMARLQGGCNVPLGAHAKVSAGEILNLRAVIRTPDGARAAHAERRGSMIEPVALGIAVAESILEHGSEILESLRTP